MALRLVGPWPLPLSALQTASARALHETAAMLAGGSLRVADGTEPGLHVVVDDGDHPVILGFWLVFGPTWVDEGPLGPPDAVPPYVEDLLEGAVHELWWQLPLRLEEQVWRPVVVFEWPDPIAQRAALPPPGLETSAATAADEEAEGTDPLWDPELDLRPRARPTRARRAQTETRGPKRSLVAIVVGELTRAGDVHRGRYALARPEEGSADLERWFRVLIRPFPPRVAEGEAPGPMLGLPGGREGWAMAGWLTRGLETWPPNPASLRVGVLPEHQVGARWVQQSRRAFVATFAVLVAVALLGAILRFLASPTLYRSPPAQPEAPQPAMSLCSPDHHQFVSELRCQVAALSSGDNLPAGPVCGDERGMGVSPDVDLQAAWCGLLDRSLDGWTPGEGSPGFGEEALARACFNVLGHPYAYLDQHAAEGVPRVDAAKLLFDPTMHVASATELLEDLKRSCTVYRERLSLRVEGEILATHIGMPWTEAPTESVQEAASLRDTAVTVATSTLTLEGARCVRAGVEQGAQPERYDALCGHADDEPSRPKAAGWSALGTGRPAGPVVERYLEARFGARGDGDVPEPLWRCRRSLTRGQPALPSGALMGRWDLTLPLPSRLDAGGGGAVTSQLELEAGLYAMEDGAPAGACWEVIAGRLSTWPRLHPLDQGDPKSWPSEEQQVCGAICAARYGVLTPRVPWLTPSADMHRCVDSEPPSPQARPGLDRLALPYSQTAKISWVTPSTADICAFHLLAQGRVSGLVLGDDRDAPEWAGETAPRSGRAGGQEGEAVKAIRNMERFGAGAGFGIRSCRDVAAQCALATLLEVADPERGVERLRWVERYRRRLDELARATPSELGRTRPWCMPVQPYLDEVKDLAIIDSPCQRGVVEAREAVDTWAEVLVRGRVGEGSP